MDDDPELQRHHGRHGGNGFQFNGVYGAGGGGNGITLNAAHLSAIVNHAGATIAGGSGGSGSTTWGAGGGGDGVSIAGSSVTITNFGVISGGFGGYAGGPNGNGITLLGDYGRIVNAGTIEGGTGLAIVGNRNMITNLGSLTGRGMIGLSLNGQDNWLALYSGSTNIGLVTAAKSGNVLAFGGPAYASFNAALLGSGGQYIGFDFFEKAGSSTLPLFGANTYSGATSVNQGTLRTGSAGSLSSASAMTVAAGAVLDLAGFNQEIGSLAGAGNVLLGTGTLTTSRNGSNTTFSGDISGTGSLTKTGAGTLTLAGANTYGGGTTVNQGAVEVQNRDALGTSLVRLAGGHLRSNIAGTATLPNEIRFQPGQTSTVSAAPGQTLNIDFFASGTGSTIRFGTPTDTGTIIVAGPSFAYSRHALEVNGGTLRAGSDQLSSHLNGAHTVTVARDATLDLATYDTRINALQGDGTLISDAPRLRILSGTFGGTIAGSAAFVKPWTGTLTLTGTSTLTGPTMVEGGLLVVNGSLASSPVSVSEDTTLSTKGTLGGTGTIGGLAVQSGGTVAPGNSIGTLNVAGDLSFGPGSFYALEPFVGASVLRLSTDTFQEQGGAAALTGFGRSYDLGTTTVGLRAEARLSETLPLTLSGLLGWRHAVGDVAPEALLAFAGGAAAFSVAGVPVDRDALVAQAGLDWRASEALSLGVSYSGQIGERAQEHAVKGNLTWRFGDVLNTEGRLRVEVRTRTVPNDLLKTDLVDLSRFKGGILLGL